ncbi:MAG: patatin-like phospholipase family protein [Burkholderiaceae bacterium]|nr:patatin-like phospholipase family protein [Burkholderiaceae bacterium]
MATRTRKPRSRPSQAQQEGFGAGAEPAPHYCESSGNRQVVLVLQGGGALGAYQVGVYQALHEAGIEPDWVIGTSIGAINAALIAGNPCEQRLPRLQQFWHQMEHRWSPGQALAPMGLARFLPNAATVVSGIPGFFKPNAHALRGVRAEVGVEQASYYSTEPLRETLLSLVDFAHIGAGGIRLTVGAVNANSGAMHYFDSRDQSLGVDHIMASGALPPAFPAVRIDGQPYWDGGIYSNTPIEAVLDDNPRHDSLIFAVNVWHQTGAEPASIWDVMGRQKDIQFASRADSHLTRQKQIHRLRHVIQALAKELPVARQLESRVHELAALGCSTTMHVVHLVAPRLPGEDHTKDIDFTPAGVRARREAGYADTLQMIGRAPWQDAVDPIEGVIEHR